MFQPVSPLHLHLTSLCLSSFTGFTPSLSYEATCQISTLFLSFSLRGINKGEREEEGRKGRKRGERGKKRERGEEEGRKGRKEKEGKKRRKR